MSKCPEYEIKIKIYSPVVVDGNCIGYDVWGMKKILSNAGKLSS